MAQYNDVVIEQHTEQSVGQGFLDAALDFDRFSLQYRFPLKKQTEPTLKARTLHLIELRGVIRSLARARLARKPGVLAGYLLPLPLCLGRRLESQGRSGKSWPFQLSRPGRSPGAVNFRAVGHLADELIDALALPDGQVVDRERSARDAAGRSG